MADSLVDLWAASYMTDTGSRVHRAVNRRAEAESCPCLGIIPGSDDRLCERRGLEGPAALQEYF
jgi:hypothetical protein